MEFTVTRANLIRELKLLAGVVESKSTIPILSHVLVEAREDSIVLTASDLETSLRCTCPAKVKTKGEGTVPAKALLHYAQLLPETDIQIKIQENFWVGINCARSKAKIPSISRESYPTISEAGAVIAEIPIGQLSSLIGRTEFAISKEESRFTLAGALLVLEPESLAMVTTDGHRLAYVQVKSAAGTKGRLMLPHKALLQILRLASEEESTSVVKISKCENTLSLAIGSRTLFCRELTGNFPDYNRVLPKDAPHSVTLDRVSLQAAIGRVAQFSDERSHAIRLSITKNEVKLDSSSIEIGESEDGIPCDYEGPPMEIGFNSVYLLDFLKATAEDKVTLHFKDAKSGIELRPGGEKQEYRYIVMPMRV